MTRTEHTGTISASGIFSTRFLIPLVPCRQVKKAGPSNIPDRCFVWSSILYAAVSPKYMFLHGHFGQMVEQKQKRDDAFGPRTVEIAPISAYSGLVIIVVELELNPEWSHLSKIARRGFSKVDWDFANRYTHTSQQIAQEVLRWSKIAGTVWGLLQKPHPQTRWYYMINVQTLCLSLTTQVPSHDKWGNHGILELLWLSVHDWSAAILNYMVGPLAMLLSVHVRQWVSQSNWLATQSTSSGCWHTVSATTCAGWFLLVKAAVLMVFFSLAGFTL